MEIIQYNKKAIIFGATGLIGRHCLEELLAHDSYEQILSFGRRASTIEHPKLKEIIIEDFEELEAYKPYIKGNDLFLCLGTTRAKAGKEGFVKVDFEYAFTVAKLAVLNEANQLMLVSSVGADKESLFLYTKVKGALEDAVTRLPFWSIHIFRPSFLIGDRTELRFGEIFGATLSRLFEQVTQYNLKKYSPVEATTVAKAMVLAAQGFSDGIYIYESHEIQEMVRKTTLGMMK